MSPTVRADVVGSTTFRFRILTDVTHPPEMHIMGLPGTPVSGAFDSSGSLWISITVADAPAGGDRVVEFSEDQLTAGPADRAMPNVRRSRGSTSPAGVAFDADGNLWVANGATNTVVMFSPAQLAADDTEMLDAAVTIRADAKGSLNNPTGVAFDADGNLWVSNTDSHTVVKFTPTQLAVSGKPTPDVTISATARAILGPSVSLYSPEGLAFDSSGDLWVANVPTQATLSSLVRFSGVGDLSGDVSPDPATTIATDKGVGLSLSSPAFSPSDLPILP